MAKILLNFVGLYVVSLESMLSTHDALRTWSEKVAWLICVIDEILDCCIVWGLYVDKVDNVMIGIYAYSFSLHSY